MAAETREKQMVTQEIDRKDETMVKVVREVLHQVHQQANEEKNVVEIAVAKPVVRAGIRFKEKMEMEKNVSSFLIR